MAVDPSVVINLAAEYTGKKAFSQADKATQQLSKSVKSLAKAFGLVFSVQAAKNAVRAFAADDKAAKTLSRTLNNLGLAYADPAVKEFISSLEKQFGVLDDQLRPSFQKLLTTTGNYVQAQDLLKTALDLSAMSGIDVVTVSGDLARAYTGNTRALGKYNLGIDKADLATLSFSEILTRVAKVSSGQAQAAADTLAGSMGKLQVATANASESLGKDLVTALTGLGGTGGLPKTLSLIESLASAIGDAIIGFSRLIQLVVIFGSGNPLESIKDAAAFNKANLAADLAEAAAGNSNFGSKAAKDAAAKLAAAAAKAAALKLATDKKAAAAAAALAAKKAKNSEALSKAAANFDLTRISIAAALRATFDKETTLRLLAMQAIENDNGELALKYLEQLGVLQKAVQTDKLAGITTINAASLASLNATLLAELAAIDKTKMSEDDKNKARDAAFAKYNDAITKQGGLAAANTYSELTQIQLVSIAKLAALQGYGAALATLNTVMTSNEKAIALTQSANDLARYMALKDYIALLGVAYNAAIALAQASAGKAVPGGKPFVPPGGSPFVPIPGFPGIGSSKDEKDAKDDVIAAIIAKVVPAAAIAAAAATDNGTSVIAEIIAAVVPAAAIAAAASEDAALAIAAIANNTDPTMIDWAAIYAAAETSSRDDRGRSSDNITVNISAGVIASQEEFVALVQDAVQVNNRRGNNLEVAGII